MSDAPPDSAGEFGRSQREARAASTFWTMLTPGDCASRLDRLIGAVGQSTAVGGLYVVSQSGNEHGFRAQIWLTPVWRFTIDQ